MLIIMGITYICISGMSVLRRQERVSARPFWKEMFTDYLDRFPNLLMLAEICLVFPVQTACCEHGNSCLAPIMTVWRSSLNADTLEALMHISIDGCENCTNFTTVLYLV